MKNFLSCDWGSSRLRTRLVETEALHWEQVEDNARGIVQVWEERKRKRAGAESGRFGFYYDIIKEQIRALEQRLSTSLDKLPLVISGMASSSIGIMELEYKRIPFSCSGDDLETKRIIATDAVPRDIVIISGARSETDAMRGEETQLVGCDHGRQEPGIFIFPGTHSKHVFTEEGQVKEVRTYMTGEFFALLAEKSVLSHSVTSGKGLGDANYRKAFEKGMEESKAADLLHSAFLVRVNELFGRIGKEENYYFLSGLLIGAELWRLKDSKGTGVTLVASGTIGELYINALKGLGIVEGENGLKIEDADRALVKGQMKILKRLLESADLE